MSAETQTCHTCGKPLPWNRIYADNRPYCGVECIPGKVLGVLPDPRIATLEADLKEALDIITAACVDCCPVEYDVVREWDGELRRALRFLAKHGRFKITRDDELTEGEWIQPS